MIKSYADLVQWIRDNVPPAELGQYGEPETPEKAALWFLAIEEAHIVYDMRLKDIARMFIQGMTPLDAADVTQWLATQWEDCELLGGALVVNNTIIRKLQTHFGMAST